VERQVSLDDIRRIAGSAGPFSPENNRGSDEDGVQGPSCKEAVKNSGGAPPGKAICIAVARDDAFHFYYEDLFDELKKRGCRVVPFSPLGEANLPAGIDALYIGGGYPEEYAEALAGNESMKEDIREFARSGRPVYGECGGLMYLSEVIGTRDNNSCPMVGIVPARTRMLDRIKSLGYVEVALQEDSLWGKKGDLLRGHEFHYSELIMTPAGKDGWRPVYDMTYRRTSAVYQEGFQKGNILASYVHLHLASRPAALEEFLTICRKFR
jgi:cobyrinic acid a,c-diamide synthase